MKWRLRAKSRSGSFRSVYRRSKASILLDRAAPCLALVAITTTRSKSTKGCLGIAIGDVSGKGISAALLMASLRACLRTMTRTTSGELTQLMSHMNRLIYEASAINRYATFFFGIFDPAVGRFHYVNAGHNPPVLLRKSASGKLRMASPRLRRTSGRTLAGSII